MRVDAAALQDFIDRKLGIRTCEACGMTLWRPDPIVYELRERDDSGTAADYAATVPLIRLSCGKCGNTKVFDAVTAGLVAPD